MKKYLFLILIGLMAAGLAAQTGILGLSFGDSREEALANLAEQGFTLDSSEGNLAVLSSQEIYEIASVELSFDSNAELSAWAIAYGDAVIGETEYEVVEELKTLHGEDYDYDEEYEEYYWSLDANHHVTAAYDWDYELFWVEYYTE